MPRIRNSAICNLAKCQRNSGGFTLTELLISVGLAGIVTLVMSQLMAIQMKQISISTANSGSQSFAQHVGQRINRSTVCPGTIRLLSGIPASLGGNGNPIAGTVNIAIDPIGSGVFYRSGQTVPVFQNMLINSIYLKNIYDFSVKIQGTAPGQNLIVADIELQASPVPGAPPLPPRQLGNISIQFTGTSISACGGADGPLISTHTSYVWEPGTFTGPIYGQCASTPGFVFAPYAPCNPAAAATPCSYYIGPPSNLYQIFYCMAVTN